MSKYLSNIGHVALLLGQYFLVGYLYKKDPALAAGVSTVLAGGNMALPSPLPSGNKSAQ